MSQNPANVAPAMPSAIITLTTDFGEGSSYVAAMKGVILSINPVAQIVDVSHRIAPQNVRQGAIVRPMGAFGAPGALRITVGTPDENAFFAEALASVRAATA